MPLDFARRLVGVDRTAHADRRLGASLAFVAGAMNAGGFLAVHRYTSHMTGILSGMADDLATGAVDLAAAGLAALAAFMCGAACSTMLVNFGRRRALRSVFAMPLLLEALLLLAFGLLGARLADTSALFVPATVILLCFIMGLQNALITKLSYGEMRTTHMTGVVTDIGIELGKMLYWNRSGSQTHPPVRANTTRLVSLAILAASFFGGALSGALAFQHAGYVATVPLASVLVALAAVPTLDDVVSALRGPA